MVWTGIADMPKYKVEMNARIDLRYSLEVEAADEDEAMELAVKNAPSAASYWEVDGDTVTQVEADYAEEVE